MNLFPLNLFLMKKCVFIALVSLFHFSCNENKTEVQLKPYPEFKEELQLFNGNLSEKQDRFFTFINNDVPNYWVGTKWDFNGTTRLPKSGTIACGYFVTTVLDDFGIKLKRIYLAQQVSSVMISTLCEKKSIKNFSTIDQVENYLKNRNKKEIFIVGLDFHTGFIIKDDSKMYFLHSNYIKKEGVVKEEIRNSKALLSSKSFMIGSVSKNPKNFE